MFFACLSFFSAIYTPKKFPFLCSFSSLLDILIFSLSWISVFPLFLCNNICISCRWAADWLISWSGHPRPSHCWALVYRGCPCRDPPVWWLIQAGMMSHQSANPNLLLCSGVLLHWLHSWRVHLQHYQTWPMLCTHLTTQENQTKLRRDLTWLAWLENSTDLDTLPSSMRVHFRIHNRAAEVFSRSSTRPLRPVSVLLCLLVLWCSRASWFASSPVPWLPSPCWWCKVLSSTWSSTCVCSSVSPCLTWTLRFNIDHGLLDLPRHSLPRRSRFQLHSRFVTCRRHRFLRISVMELLDRERVTIPLPGLIVTFVLFWMYLFLEDSLWFDCPFSALYFLLLHTFLSFQKARFFWTISDFAVSFCFSKRRKIRCFLLLPVSPLHYDKLFFIENLCWLILKLPLVFKKLFTFTTTNATRFLFERLLCLLIHSFCSSSIHLFSFFWSLRVFPFLSPFFCPFWFFHWSWMSLCFYIDNLFFTNFWIFVNFC